jgi:general secretion pathway protein M
MRTWWETRSRREQALLAVMAAGVAAFLLWFAVLTPLAAANRAAEARYATAVETDLAVSRTLGEVARLKAPPAPASARRPLDAVVSETAAAAGVNVGRIEADPSGGLRVSSPSAPASALFPWLALLQREHGIVATHLTVLKNDTGGLAVDATLARPAR